MRRLARTVLALILLGLLACRAPAAAPAPRPSPTAALSHTPTRAPATATARPPSATPTPSPTPAAPNKAGIHLLLDDGRNAWPMQRWAEHLDYAARLVGDWGYVTELVRGDDLVVSRWQRFMDLCAERRLVPVIRLATTFDRERGFWRAPQADPDGHYGRVAAEHAAFVAALRWPTGDHYVVVGNEPNHGDEWGGAAAPAEYARFLVDVAAAIHAADPAARVLNAALDPFTPHTNGQPFANGMTYMDAESFMDEMALAEPGAFAAIDVWASHSYPLGPLAEPPWKQAFQIDLINGALNPRHLAPPAGLFNRGVNGYEWELFKLASLGITGLPVMITETGWRHAESDDPAALDNGRAWPPAATAAGYLDLAFRGNGGRYPQWPEAGWTPWNADARVLAVTPFALDGHPREWGHTNWLRLDESGAVLETYPMFDVLAKR